MDRRQFIRVSGIGAAGLGLASCTGSRATGENPGPGQPGRVVENYEGVGLLGYGCMRWPMTDEGDEIDQEEVNRLVDCALEHGVTYFDSSPAYTKGLSEKATATALARHPRSSYLIATKLSNFRGNHSFEEGVSMYRRSLEIYATDHLDYYLLHAIRGYDDFCRRYQNNSLMDFLLAERSAGRIRNLGFSFHGSREDFDAMLALHGKYHWDFVQIQMNYVDWHHAGASYLYEKLAALDIPVVVMEPLLGGRLATLPAALSDRLAARRSDKSAASWAFRFCGSFPKVLTVLSGMTYMEHLEDNLQTFSGFVPLDAGEMDELEEIAGLLTRFPLVNCTGCRYCMPCPYGIDIPSVFKFYNDNVNAGTYVTGPEQENYARMRRSYLLRYDKAVEYVRQASHCIGCGKCMDACPQHIRIPVEMARIDEYVEKLKRRI